MVQAQGWRAMVFGESEKEVHVGVPSVCSTHPASASAVILLSLPVLRCYSASLSTMSIDLSGSGAGPVLENGHSTRRGGPPGLKVFVWACSNIRLGKETKEKLVPELLEFIISPMGFKYFSRKPYNLFPRFIQVVAGVFYIEAFPHYRVTATPPHCLCSCMVLLFLFSS